MMTNNKKNKNKTINNTIQHITRTITIAGGCLFIAIACITVISVLSRYFLNAPIQGDVEIVEIGSVIAIACFMPWCQWKQGHVTVEIFTEKLPQKIKNIIDIINLIIMSAALTLLAVQTAKGAADMFTYQDQTMFLSLKLWGAAAFLALIMTLSALIAIIMTRYQPDQ